MKQLRICCAAAFKHRLFPAVLLAVFFAAPALDAQSFRPMSLNGSTGLYSIPSGRTAWEKTSSFGLDFGYHAVIKDRVASHLPKISVGFLKWVEATAAFDIQPDGYRTDSDGTDFIGGLKIQFPFENTALALGGNFQALNLGNSAGGYKAGQIYAAATYAGRLFSWPAETTVVIGKTLVEDGSGSDIDFGMGFDMVLLPEHLDRLIHWVTDFANFSYSAEAFGAEPGLRGVLNTGIRLDISAIPALSKFKFTADIFLTDAFDRNRAFSVGAVFGVPFL